MISYAKFSPKSGFDHSDLKTQLIGNFTTSAALEWGTVVDADATGVLSVSGDYGYFAMAEAVADIPELDVLLGIYHQNEVKIGKPISVLIPQNGAQVYTVHVAQGGGAPALAIGQYVKIVSGKFVTDTALTATTAKGKIIELPATSGQTNTSLYVVQIMNANA